MSAAPVMSDPFVRATVLGALCRGARIPNAAVEAGISARSVHRHKGQSESFSARVAQAKQLSRAKRIDERAMRDLVMDELVEHGVPDADALAAVTKAMTGPRYGKITRTRAPIDAEVVEPVHLPGDVEPVVVEATPDPPDGKEYPRPQSKTSMRVLSPEWCKASGLPVFSRAEYIARQWEVFHDPKAPHAMRVSASRAIDKYFEALAKSEIAAARMAAAERAREQDAEQVNGTQPRTRRRGLSTEAVFALRRAVIGPAPPPKPVATATASDG